MDPRRSTETSAAEQASLTLLEHAVRIGLVMAAAVALLAWGLRHTETSLGDGLRYLRQAEEIERGAWREGMVGSIDHPLHPLAIVAAHRVVGDFGPVAWQRAAVALAFGCIVLLAVPSYLLSRELFGDRTAWLASSMVVTHRLCSVIVANALCESTFLLLWMWGLWAAVRFLREGRFVWLPVTIGFGVLAYLSRPEGMLLPLAMIASLGILPLHRATRINWPRWWRAVAFLSIGSLALAGPYMALKGSLGTKPGIARVLGLAPVSPPDAPEREQPLAADQSPLQTYRLATNRMLKVVRDGVSTPLLPLAVLGIVMMRRGAGASTHLALSGRDPFCQCRRSGPATRNGGLLHGPPRTHTDHDFDAGRGPWALLGDAANLNLRQASGSTRTAARAGPCLLAARLRNAHRAASPGTVIARDCRPVQRLPRCGSLAGAECPRRRPNPRSDRLVALFQPARGIPFRPGLQGTCRPSNPVGRRPASLI